MKTDLQGDYIGFSFGGVHSSSLGIVRVSDGNRYTQNLFPSFSDSTSNVPGGDETYYFGTTYSQRTISFPIAFDCVEEKEVRAMQQLFAPDGSLKELWFDELPFKAWTAKIIGTPYLKFLPFDETYRFWDSAQNKMVYEKKRVFKGEGELSFSIYYPFAHSRFKYLDEASSEEIYNLAEWQPSINLKATKGSYDAPGVTTQVYNPGDLPTDYKLFYSRAQFQNLTKLSLQVSGNEQMLGVLNFSSDKVLNETDTYICINSKTNLIEGYDAAFNQTGTLYNRYVISGDFFKIPTNASIGGGEIQLVSTGAQSAKIEYDYLYF